MLVVPLGALSSGPRQTHSLLLLSGYRARGSLDGPDRGSDRRCRPSKGEAAPLVWKLILINLVSNHCSVFLSICGPVIKYAADYLQVSISSCLHSDFPEKVTLQWNSGTRVSVWSRGSRHGAVTAFCTVRFKRRFWNTTTHTYCPLFPRQAPPCAATDGNTAGQRTGGSLC